MVSPEGLKLVEDLLLFRRTLNRTQLGQGGESLLLSCRVGGTIRDDEDLGRA